MDGSTSVRQKKPVGESCWFWMQEGFIGGSSYHAHETLAKNIAFSAEESEGLMTQCGGRHLSARITVTRKVCVSVQ